MRSVTIAPALRLVAGLIGAWMAAIFASTVLSCGYSLLIAFGDARHIPPPQVIFSNIELFAAGAAYISGQISIIAIALFALPHVIVSRRLNKTSRKYFVASGAVIGLITVVAVLVWQGGFLAPQSPMGRDEYFLLVTSMVVGAIAAFVYWKIARPVDIRDEETMSPKKKHYVAIATFLVVIGLSGIFGYVTNQKFFIIPAAVAVFLYALWNLAFVCPKCGTPYLYAFKGITIFPKRFPARCETCGWPTNSEEKKH